MAVYDKERDTKNPENIWGRRINKVLSEKKMTQSELAEKSGIPASTISGWISNQGNSSIVEPKINGFMNVAKALGVSTDYLLGRHECKTPQNEEIQKLTGLSDNAITSLKFLQKKMRKNDISSIKKLRVLSYLIESNRNTPLLEDLFDYLFGNYYFKSKDGDTLKETTSLISNVNGEELRLIAYRSIIGQAHFVEVQSDLVRLKDELTPKYGKKEYEEWEKEHKEELNKALCENIEQKEREELSCQRQSKNAGIRQLNFAGLWQ